MKAGKLRHRVTLQRKTETRNDFKEVVVGWADVATVWASVEPLKGREFFASQQVNASVTGRIIIRYRAGVTSDMRALHDGRTFDIIGPPIDPEERHVELHLMVSEVT